MLSSEGEKGAPDSMSNFDSPKPAPKSPTMLEKELDVVFHRVENPSEATEELPINNSPEAKKNRDEFSLNESRLKALETKVFKIDGEAQPVRIKFRFDEQEGVAMVDVTTSLGRKESLTLEEFSHLDPEEVISGETSTIKLGEGKK